MSTNEFIAYGKEKVGIEIIRIDASRRSESEVFYLAKVAVRNCWRTVFTGTENMRFEVREFISAFADGYVTFEA
jgi:hypothetical protein